MIAGILLHCLIASTTARRGLPPSPPPGPDLFSSKLSEVSGKHVGKYIFKTRGNHKKKHYKHYKMSK